MNGPRSLRVIVPTRSKKNRMNVGKNKRANYFSLIVSISGYLRSVDIFGFFEKKTYATSSATDRCWKTRIGSSPTIFFNKNMSEKSEVKFIVKICITPLWKFGILPNPLFIPRRQPNHPVYVSFLLVNKVESFIQARFLFCAGKGALMVSYRRTMLVAHKWPGLMSGCSHITGLLMKDSHTICK